MASTSDRMNLVNSVIDPFRPEGYEEELERLTEVLRTKDLNRTHGGKEVLMDLAGGLATALTILLVQANPVNSIVGGLTVFLAFFTVGRLRYTSMRRARARHEDFTARHPTAQLSPIVTYEVFRIASAIRNLPEDKRGELRPLWDSVMEANKLLGTVGYDEEAVERVKARARAASEFLTAHRELEALELASKRRDRIEAAKLQYGSQDDSDLELARLHTEALGEGARVHRALGVA